MIYRSYDHHVLYFLLSLVPDDSSAQLLHFVQALLATHTESKLNTNMPSLPSHFHRSKNWCEHLKHPSHR